MTLWLKLWLAVITIIIVMIIIIVNINLINGSQLSSSKFDEKKNPNLTFFKNFLTFRVLTHSKIHSFKKRVIAVILLVYRYVTSYVLTRSSKDPFQVVQEARPFFIGHTREWIIRVCVFQFHHQLSQRTVLWELLELKTVFQISLNKWMRSAPSV